MPWINFAEIRQQVSLADVLFRFYRLTTLKRDGDTVVGPCPIHQGDSPRALLFGGQSMWVMNALGGTLSQLTATGCAANPDPCGKTTNVIKIDQLPTALSPSAATSRIFTTLRTRPSLWFWCTEVNDFMDRADADHLDGVLDVVRLKPEVVAQGCAVPAVLSVDWYAVNCNTAAI